MPKDTKKFVKKAALNHFLTNYETEEFDMQQSLNDKPGKEVERKMAATLDGDEGAWANKRERELPNDIPKLMERSAITDTSKRIKTASYAKISVETFQKNFSNSMRKQFKERKGSRDSLMQSLNALVSQFKSEEETLQANNQRLRQWCSTLMKESDQMLRAQQQKVQALSQLCTEYTKQLDETEASHAQDTLKLEKDVASSMMELEERLQQQYSRDKAEAFRKVMTMVEGLINRGAMKPDERPIWFDVYRAFPPITEPKFARPKPVKEPIRPILYPEDEQRAKFHGLGHGLGAVNMLSTSGDTHIKRLLRNYEQLKSEGLPEEKLIEQCVATAESERRLPSPKVTSSTPDPQSVTGQVFAEANIKNIFREN